ncbi:hypothetical protein B5S33_g1038 [[Candida] boidinii]|nr:hypothetical protein B5S33_g1038 [[Candida] boidinii]
MKKFLPSILTSRQSSPVPNDKDDDEPPSTDPQQQQEQQSQLQHSTSPTTPIKIANSISIFTRHRNSTDHSPSSSVSSPNSSSHYIHHISSAPLLKNLSIGKFSSRSRSGSGTDISQLQTQINTQPQPPKNSSLSNTLPLNNIENLSSDDKPTTSNTSDNENEISDVISDTNEGSSISKSDSGSSEINEKEEEEMKKAELEEELLEKQEEDQDDDDNEDDEDDENGSDGLSRRYSIHSSVISDDPIVDYAPKSNEDNSNKIETIKSRHSYLSRRMSYMDASNLIGGEANKGTQSGINSMNISRVPTGQSVVDDHDSGLPNNRSRIRKHRGSSDTTNSPAVYTTSISARNSPVLQPVTSLTNISANNSPLLQPQTHVNTSNITASPISRPRSQESVVPTHSNSTTEQPVKRSDSQIEEAIESNDKVFSFTLPFGVTNFSENNIAESLLSSLKSSIPFLKDPEEEKEEMEVMRIREKMKRFDSISTMEEALLYKDTKSFGNTRLEAVKKAFTPSIISSPVPGYNDDVFDQLQGDVLILGGYRGSILRDTTTHSRSWIPVIKAGFNFKKIDLVVGYRDEDELNAEDYNYPDGILSHIGPVDICRKLMKKLRSNEKVTLHNFGYDWRLSLDLTSEKLFMKLTEINAKNGGKGCIVIAHSMGGLVAHYTMQKDPSLFRGLLYMGVPYPCPNILGPLRVGDKVLFSSTLLSAEANFFMRSSFVFLPKNGEIFKNSETGEKYKLNFFDPEVWVEYNLSPLVSKGRKIFSESEKKKKNGKLLGHKRHRAKTKTATTSIDRFSNVTFQESDFKHSFDQSYDYLCRTLKRTEAFIDALEFDETKEYPPLALIYGATTPSVRFSMVKDRESIKRGEYWDFAYGIGDGVVHRSWLLPEVMGFPLTAKIPSNHGHVSLMTDFEAIAEALRAILQEEEKRKNSHADIDC